MEIRVEFTYSKKKINIIMTYFAFWSVYSLKLLQTLTIEVVKFQQFTYISYANQIEHPVPIAPFDLML